MKILVTGAGGMLGSAVIPALQSCGHDVVATDLAFKYAKLDVRSQRDVEWWMKEIRPDIVAHLAAETSLEVCETDPDHAWLTNAIGTRNIALACRRTETAIAYISSAGVFDGTKDEAYTEFDTPNPINVYGASKYEGEKIIRQLVPNAYIIRAGWMMGGWNGKDHKFVHHMMSQIEAGEPTLYAVDDKFGSPTYAPDFADRFESLIQSENFGTYHMASGGSCSRFDVAEAIAAISGANVEVKPISSDHFATEFFAPRPRSEVMRNYVMDLEGSNTMRPWRDALEDYLREWYQ